MLVGAVRIRQVLASVWLLAVAAGRGAPRRATAPGLFWFRTVRSALYWSQHHKDPIEHWMTVNYVTHSYDVPPEVLWAALDLPPARPPSRDAWRPLSAIAAAGAQAAAGAAADAHRSGQPLSEIVFSWLAEYGLLPAAAILVLTSIGAPLPASLLLLSLGSFVAEGELCSGRCSWSR